jgi:hypothetical protein
VFLFSTYRVSKQPSYVIFNFIFVCMFVNFYHHNSQDYLFFTLVRSKDGFQEAAKRKCSITSNVSTMRVVSVLRHWVTKHSQVWLLCSVCLSIHPSFFLQHCYTRRFGYCVLSVFLSTHLSFYNIVTLAGLAGMFSNMFCLSFYQLFNLFTTLLCQPVLAGYFLLCSVCLSINLSVFLQFCYTSRFWWEYYIITLSFFFHLVTVTGFQEYLSFYLF